MKGLQFKPVEIGDVTLTNPADKSRADKLAEICVRCILGSPGTNRISTNMQTGTSKNQLFLKSLQN